MDLGSFCIEESNALNEFTETDDLDMLSFNIEEKDMLNELDKPDEKYDEMLVCQLLNTTQVNGSFATMPYHYNTEVLQHPPTDFFSSNKLSKSTTAFIESCLKYNLDIAIKILISKASYSTDKIDIQHTLVHSFGDYEIFSHVQSW